LGEAQVSDSAGAVVVDRSPTGLGRIFGAFSHNPYYRTYWFGNQASTLMMMMQGVAQGYLAYTLTGSATALGIVGLAQGLPQFFFAPVGGVIADRYAKRNLLLLIQLVLCLTSLVIGVLIGLHLIQYWHLVVTGFIQGLCFSMYMPARQSWIPSLVAPEDLPNAIALNNAGLNASRILGPAIGGLLIAIPWFNVNGVYYLRVVAFVWVLYSLLQVPIKGEAEKRRAERVVVELTAGLRYIVGHETLAPLFTLALVTLLLGSSYQMLLPAFALNTLNVGSEGLGFMMATVGVGALCGSLSMAYFSRSKRKGRIQAVAGTLLGVSLAAFGLLSGFHVFPLVLVALFVVGISNDFYSTINNTLIMLNTDRALYGRVMAVYMMTWALSSLSAAPFGALMDHIGGPPTMLLIGGTLALFVAGMAAFHPGYRRLT
jgi:MFS family permease